MKKILPLFVVGVLVLSGLGVAAVTNNKAIIDNRPPEAPDIDGPLNGRVGVSYLFVFCTTDPDGDDVSYFIEWRDDTSTGWTLYFESGEEAEYAHKWSKIDHYDLRCKAKDIHGAESDWGYMEVEISKNGQQASNKPISQSVMNVIPSSRIIINNGSLSGYVNDTDMDPIEGARVRVYFHETYEENYTDSSGYYHVTNIPICYCLKNATCSKDGYKTEWVLLGIVENTTHDFILTSSNEPPDTPTIWGPTGGKVGVDYVFIFRTTDPEEDDVYYYIDWGDGNMEEWIGPFGSGEEFIVNHTWHEKGCYLFRCKAKDHPYGAESDWFEFIFRVEKKNKISSKPLSLRYGQSQPRSQQSSTSSSNQILQVVKTTSR